MFVVMPVFNRVHHTISCLDHLLMQSYVSIRIIVVDGGSTDGTQERISREYPQVELLQHQKELWWGEAMQIGIEQCLRHSRRDDDMLLMMNNDTLIDPEYVGTLVRVSQERTAAVGGVIVDSSDSSRVLDAGEFIDWTTYSFPVQTERQPTNTFVEGVDLLSGRGTLLPLWMVRQAGNVNGTRFPHYIADCEFFARLKRRGFRLGVTWEATIRSHVGVTGLSTHHASPLTLVQVWQALFSIRSMDRVRDHWRFIEDCAPAELRSRLKRQLMYRSAYLVVSRTILRHVVLPVAWYLGGLYYVTRQDCAEAGCDADILVAGGILKAWRRPDWFVFEPAIRTRLHSRELKALYRRAWNPATKLTRWIKAKSQLKDGDRGAENAIIS